MKRAVIAGATGAIGMALIEKLLCEKVEILVLCRPSSKRIQRIPKHELITFAECSLSDMCSYTPFLDKRYDVFYHFAWEGTFGMTRNDMYLQNRNVKYTLDAVNLAKSLGCHTFVGAGSQAEYGRVEGTLTPSTPTFPENGYGMAKLCAGQMSRELCHQYGIKHIWTRILSVYGPYDGENTMVMSTIIKLLKGKMPQFTKGEQMWDYLYSGDAANVMYFLGEKGHSGKVYCIGSGKALPLRDYIFTIRDAIDSNADMGLGKIPYSEKQVMYLCADISDLVSDTGYRPETSFEDGIVQTIRYYLTQV